MLPQPPPDETCDEFALDLDKVYLRAVGQGEGHTVEVLAFEGPRFYRFDLASHARVVRKFYRANGVKNENRLAGGVVETSTGYGPFSMAGVVVGYDWNPTATDGDEKTFVLRDVVLGGP